MNKFMNKCTGWTFGDTSIEDGRPVYKDHSGISLVANKIEYLKKCHDCGKFVPRDRWINKQETPTMHPLCANCASAYETPYDY